MVRYKNFRKLKCTVSREPYGYCNECGKRLNFSENATWAYPVSIWAADGNFSSRYAEPVCDKCFDKFYVECAHCGEYHAKACCFKTGNGEWLCDVCRGENYAPTLRIVIA